MNIKERPILFSPEMVNAILEGRKTQTRRLFKLPKSFIWVDEEKGICAPAESCPEAEVEISDLFCKYGSVGDCLWVRETWAKSNQINDSTIFYRATDSDIKQRALSYSEREDRWRPSIFMPRWASRITLEIKNIRVERLKEISEADVIAEGCPKEILYGFGWYRDLWADINGKESWDSNPWVWIVEFEMKQ